MIDFDAANGVMHIRPFLSVTMGILALFAGKALNERVGFLGRYNIPEPVTGGLLFALVFTLAYFLLGTEVEFELTARDVLLVYFFTTIGLNARVSDIRKGGKPLLTLLAVMVALMVAQNATGTGLAAAMGYPPAAGLLGGSVSLVGGHGTAIAWAPVFRELGIGRALEIGVASATIGLVLASLAGGPVAKYLINKHQLEGGDEQLDVGVREKRSPVSIDYLSFLWAILAIHLAGIVGIIAFEALESVGFQLPLFVTCLLGGILLTNLQPRLLPRLQWPTRTPAMALIAEVSLGVFLAMSLMSMKIWTVADAAGPLLLVLAVQLAITVAFALLVVFPVLGRDYQAAVMSAGFVGIGLGATPAAVANMTAVTQRHGACHIAFLIVPLVGALFIDLTNAMVIRAFLAFL